MRDLHLAALRDNYWHLGLVVATNRDGLLEKHSVSGSEFVGKALKAECPAEALAAGLATHLDFTEHKHPLDQFSCRVVRGRGLKGWLQKEDL